MSHPALLNMKRFALPAGLLLALLAAALPASAGTPIDKTVAAAQRVQLQTATGAIAL
jgi:hypothetical protein